MPSERWLRLWWQTVADAASWLTASRLSTCRRRSLTLASMERSMTVNILVMTLRALADVGV